MDREEGLLMIIDSNDCIVIFSCKTKLERRCKYEHMFADKTFKYCSKHFVHLFTIHGQYLLKVKTSNL